MQHLTLRRLPLGGQIFNYHFQLLTWDSLARTCISWGGYLLIPNFPWACRSVPKNTQWRLPG